MVSVTTLLNYSLNFLQERRLVLAPAARHDGVNLRRQCLVRLSMSLPSEDVQVTVRIVLSVADVRPYPYPTNSHNQVQYCIENDIPFLAQNGGNGWATTFKLDKSGIIINLADSGSSRSTLTKLKLPSRAVP